MKCATIPWRIGDKSVFIIYFIKRSKLQEPFINASTLPKYIDTTARKKNLTLHKTKWLKQHAVFVNKKEYFYFYIYFIFGTNLGASKVLHLLEEMW